MLTRQGFEKMLLPCTLPMYVRSADGFLVVAGQGNSPLLWRANKLPGIYEPWTAQQCCSCCPWLEIKQFLGPYRTSHHNC
jgi:hypothetical protein